MKGIVKWIIGAVVVVLLAVIAMMVVAVVVFDPDDYREVVPILFTIKPDARSRSKLACLSMYCLVAASR